MQLDPSESINNMGTLRVDVFDAADLPSADRNGFSDPYCKFVLNGKDIYKTKVQKKTLHPSWNESFECSIASRTAADFKVRVMDWDFGDKADFLGEADINLELLEPFQPQEITLGLDGKSGAVRLKLLFKPAYVTRSRQGSSTFQGTFATPGKIVGAPVKGVGKVGGAVGGGVAKGASFIRHGFKSKKDTPDTSNGFVEPPGIEEAANGTPVQSSQRAPPMFDGSPITPGSPSQLQPQSQFARRTSSIGGASAAGLAGATPEKPEAGTANFSVLNAAGYPHGAKVQVLVKQVTGKGAKDVHKSKPIKSTSDKVQWEHENFQVSCSPDTQFRIQVKDHAIFGGDDLGEAPFFIDDSLTGGEKTIQVGAGTVTLKTSFTHTKSSSNLTASPRSSHRMSFMNRREFSRGATPS